MGLFSKKITMVSPCDGDYLALENVNDPVFSKGLVGVGFAVRPRTGTILSPVEGEVTMVFPTGHAFGVQDKKGMEYLVHMGIDTVSLKGEGFQTVVKPGQFIKKGELVSVMDLDLIQSKGLGTEVLVLVTNHKDIHIQDGLSQVQAGEEIAKLEHV